MRIADCRSEISNCRSQIEIRRLQIADLKLQVADPQIIDCKDRSLKSADCEICNLNLQSAI